MSDRSKSDITVQRAAIAGALGSTAGEVADALLAKRVTFALPEHFDSRGRKLGLDPDLNGTRAGSRALVLADKLRAVFPGVLPPGCRMFLATTVGAVEANSARCDGCQVLMAHLQKLFQADSAVLVSAACASGQLAVQLAMQATASGECSSALVVGIDAATEFVFSGFSALGAVSPDICRPYDAARDGLTLGEAAAALLIGRGGDESIGRVLNWGSSCDAAHITAPDLSGKFLAQAVRTALGSHPCGGVIGHGTGTRYNDTAELNALNAVFPVLPPLYSLKGNFGHTLGATGVLQTLLAMEFSRRGELPGQPLLDEPDPLAHGAVSGATRKCSAKPLLTVNAGFGGLNSVLLVEGL